jgi:hypothetical protein
VPLNPTDPTTGPPSETRTDVVVSAAPAARRGSGSRNRRISLAAAAMAAALAGALWVSTHRPDARGPADRLRLDAAEDARPAMGRASRGLRPPAHPIDPGPRLTPPPGPGPTGGPGPDAPPTRPGRAGRTPGASTATPVGIGAGTRPADGHTSGSPAAGNPGRPGGPADTWGPPGGSDTFWLPGTRVEAPITGPLADLPDEADDELVETPAPEPEPEPEPGPEEPEPEPLDPDELGCPNLGLLPIGGFDDELNSAHHHLYPLFRALAPAEWDTDELVCGHPLEPWRDLVVQRLESGGEADGAIITAADGSSIALRLSEVEWGSYRFRYGGGPTGTNLLGYPVGRLLIDDVPMIRTTGGALVFAQADALGVPVIGGLWDLWLTTGGPSGSMGLPLGLPESAAGPSGATTWQPGLVSTGARQSFQHGWVFLPGVISDVDAAAQPADRYQWHPWSELTPEPEPALDYRGHIMKLGPTTWYVDQLGIRHWIPTTSAWSCATWDLKATQYLVEAYELDAYPLGEEFVCDDFRNTEDGAPTPTARPTPARAAQHPDRGGSGGTHQATNRRRSASPPARGRST